VKVSVYFVKNAGYYLRDVSLVGQVVTCFHGAPPTTGAPPEAGATLLTDPEAPPSEGTKSRTAVLGAAGKNLY